MRRTIRVNRPRLVAYASRVEFHRMITRDWHGKWRSHAVWERRADRSQAAAELLRWNDTGYGNGQYVP